MNLVDGIIKQVASFAPTVSEWGEDAKWVVRYEVISMGRVSYHEALGPTKAALEEEYYIGKKLLL